MRRRSVDFPQPLGPRKEINSPALTQSEMPSIACVRASALSSVGKLLLTARTRSVTKELNHQGHQDHQESEASLSSLVFLVPLVVQSFLAAAIVSLGGRVKPGHDEPILVYNVNKDA